MRSVRRRTPVARCSRVLRARSNCNHFTEQFLKLLTAKELPDYVNRIMRIARKVRPCLPGMFKLDLRDQQPPPEYDSHRHYVPQPRAPPPPI